MKVRRLRLMEWLCSAIILAIGLHLLAYPATFYRPTMIGLHDIASYNVWTSACVAVGLARMVALAVNGHWPAGTPSIRVVGALAGIGIFGLLAGAFLKATAGTAPSLAVTAYALLMVADVVSVMFATADIFHANRARR